VTPEQILSKIYARIQAIDVTGDFQAEAEAYWDCLEDIRQMIPYETARKHFAGRTAPLGVGYPHDVPLEFEGATDE